MIAECGVCGKTEVFDEEAKGSMFGATKWYVRHMLDEHPAEARQDPLVGSVLAVIAADVAPTNGALMTKALE